MDSIERVARSANPQTLDALIQDYRLEKRRDSIRSGKDFRFLSLASEVSVPAPQCLASVRGVPSGDDVCLYVLIPHDTEPPRSGLAKLVASISEGSIDKNSVYIPEALDYPNDLEIRDALKLYLNEVWEAKQRHRAKVCLEDARSPFSKLYASAMRIDDAPPMLVDGLLREHGVSVIYGDMDEFKTTLVLDMMAHVAAGAPWQGRDVKHRPVLWYALEGLEELPVRLCALEASFRQRNTPWGNDHLPISAKDRIPEDRDEWRKEICRAGYQWREVVHARETLGQMPFDARASEDGGDYRDVRYRFGDIEDLPVVVIDTLSIALGGEDEKGAKAVAFINDCLDLFKDRPDLEMASEQHNDDDLGQLDRAVASHVVIIHHQTKTGSDFAGHRAIAADTHGLYRVHRFGMISDAKRPYAGQFTPMRVKGIARPAPLRFAVEVVPVEGTKQTAAILRNKSLEVPKSLEAVLSALRELGDPDNIAASDLNACLDKVAKNRTSRMRNRDCLINAGVLEEIFDEQGKVTGYRFEEPTQF